MSNTRTTTPRRPSRAKVKPPAPDAAAFAGDAPDDGIQLWDEYVEDARPNVQPWTKRMPDGTLLEVGCPSSLQIDKLGEAQRAGDVPAMMTAIFDDDAAQIMALTADKPFTVRVKVINDVMFHYGLSLGRLPE